jgi:hypothetical protein
VLTWILALKKEDKKVEEAMDSKEEKILENPMMLKDLKNHSQTILNLVNDIKKGIMAIDLGIIIILEVVDSIITTGDNIMVIDQNKQDSTTIEDNTITAKGINKEKKRMTEL